MRHTVRARLRLMHRRIRWRLISAIPFSLIAGFLYSVVSWMGYGGSFRHTGTPEPASLGEAWRAFMFVTAFIYVGAVVWPFPLTTSSGWKEEAPPPWSSQGAEASDVPAVPYTEPSKLKVFVSLWSALTVLFLLYDSLLAWLALRWDSAADSLDIKQMGCLPIAWFFPAFTITPSTKFLSLVGIVWTNCFIWTVVLSALLWLVRLRLDEPTAELHISGPDSRDVSSLH